jgi:hypothetical protein
VPAYRSPVHRTWEWLTRRRHPPRVEDPRNRVGPPTYASIPLYQAAACSGGAFVLRDTARENDLIAVDGWEAEVRKGVRIVLARGGSEGGYDEALRAALMHSQKALDLMSVGGSNDLVIKGFDEDHVIWWPEPGGLAVRIVTFAPLGIGIGPATLTVTDAAGNEVPPAAPPLVPWHESFRYFRLSQTTEDLFDAYRNAFLALESVLSLDPPIDSA